MKPKTLFVMDEEHFPVLFGPRELSRLQARVEVRDPPLVRPHEFLAAPDRHADADFLISSWGVPALDAPILDALPRLQAVFHAAGTVKSIVTDASWRRGIRIASAAVENAKPTAEFAFAAIVLSLKRAWNAIQLLRDRGVYLQRDPLTRGTCGSTVGLLSLGKVGRMVAQRLASLDVRVVAYDPHATAEEAARLRVSLVPLEDVFATADVVSCHMPLTPQTAGLLDGSLFARLKPGATFVNTARGALVNETDLIVLLRERPDVFAVLDVTADEPPKPDCALLRLPNAVLTPHIAGSLGPECRRLGTMMVDEVERYLAGVPLVGEVREEDLATIA